MTRVGDFIDNRYRVVDKIGEGGMSEVWLVNDQRLNKMQAIKEIKKNAKTETHHVLADRIKIEADIMRRLEHPNIVKVIDYIDDGRSLYIVMDYIQGRDLLSVMKKHLRTITEEDVVDWGIQLCDALGYLHGQGIIYRDMKPGNIMLLDDGTVKIIDFGIAREYSPDKEDDTMPLGTRGYASPEAFKRGAQTDARSDIYSLGVTLFHLVTGHGPMEFVEQPTLPPIRMINPALSEGLEYVIAKATHWSPSERYQSCNEMRYDLENLDLLTKDHRRSLQRVMTMFKVFAIAGVACLVLGIGCLVASNLLRGSSYDGIMARAAVASTDEQGGQPSQAESLYNQAIDIIPSNIEPYSDLVNNVYKADSEFSTSEASRWAQLFDANQGSISNSPEYAQLCYDAGIDYFIYYAYGDELSRGTKAIDWFTRAINDYDARTAAGQECTLSANDRSHADIYLTIGGFSQLLARATQEGNEADSYREYWNNLEMAVANMSNADAVVVRLRLCDIVFEAINSPVYLSGFSRAEISETRVNSLLSEVHEQAQSLEDAAAVNALTEDLCGNILENYENAQANVESTFHNVGIQNRSSSNSSGSSGSSNGSNGSNGSNASSSSSSPSNEGRAS